MRLHRREDRRGPFGHVRGRLVGGALSQRRYDGVPAGDGGGDGVGLQDVTERDIDLHAREGRWIAREGAHVMTGLYRRRHDVQADPARGTEDDELHVRISTTDRTYDALGVRMTASTSLRIGVLGGFLVVTGIPLNFVAGVYVRLAEFQLEPISLVYACPAADHKCMERFSGELRVARRWQCGALAFEGAGWLALVAAAAGWRAARQQAGEAQNA